ncbi:MAG: ureidoacrylate peracid hydrolase [Pseudonocardiales bacterium]|nr:ureidoacrylate peracid hydrolase [Pseudonocardiales bacterium]
MLTIRGRQVRETLEELVDPASTALLVIDMQNDFCHPEGTFAAAGADVSAYPAATAAIATAVRAARAAGVMVVWVRVSTVHPEFFQSEAQLRFELRMKQSYGRTDVPEFDFCVPGSWGHEFLDELAYADGEMVVDKRRSSAFAGTDLDMLLRSNGIESLVVTGCTTEGCVDSTIRDAVSRDYYVTIVSDGVASDNASLHEAAMHVLTAYRCDHADVGAVSAAWQASVSVR